MPFPQLIPAQLSPLLADRWALTQALIGRNAWTHRYAAHIWSSWCDGGASASQIDEGGICVGTSVVGLLPLAPLGVESREVEVGIYWDGTPTTSPVAWARLVRLAADGTPDAVVASVEIGAPSGAGWMTAKPLVVPDDAALTGCRYGIRFDVVAEESDTAMSVLAYGAWSRSSGGHTDDGTSTTWTTLSTDAIATPYRPDDVYSLRVIAQNQAHLSRYTKTVGAHALASHRTYSASASPVVTTYRYRVPRGPHTGDCTARVLCSRTLAGEDASVSLVVQVDGVTQGTLAVAAEAWRTAALTGCWTADAMHDVTIVATATGGETGAATLDVLAVCIDEDALDSADYIVGGETAPTAWATPAPSACRPGEPIVASYAGGDLAERHTDRESLAQMAIWNASTTTHSLVQDWIWRSTGTGWNATAASAAAPVTLWASQMRSRVGARSVGVWARISVVAVSPGIQARVAVELNGTTMATTWHRTSAATDPGWGAAAWQYLAEVPVSADTAWTISLSAGIVDAAGAGLSGASYVRVDGVLAVEWPAVG